LGYELWTYIVVPTTSGAPSWPWLVPVDIDHATLRFFTLSAVILLSVLNRVLA
jgi:hypothetical protein